MKRKLILLLLTAVALLATVPGAYADKKEKLRAADGPYLLYEADGSMRMLCVTPKGKIAETHYAAVPEDFRFEVLSSKGEKLFTVPLHPVTRPAWKSDEAQKMLIISDPHGNWECFASVLRAGGVIDAQYDWAFGPNKLVIIGDVFDRGKDVIPIFWLIYKLEAEAAAAGGEVVFVLGNHEALVLGDDLRYTQKKYLRLAELTGTTYPRLVGPDTELGRWLATRNTMQVIGDKLFVHAGLGAGFDALGLSIPEVNELISEGLFLSKTARKTAREPIPFLYATYGPIWYRGLVYSADKYVPLAPDGLQAILDRYGVSSLFVGHTIFDDVMTFYGQRVFAVNVDNLENMKHKRSRGILIENGVKYLIYDSGKKSEIKPLK